MTRLGAVLAVLAFPLVAQAQISYVTQSRSITARAGKFNNPPQTVTANGFGVFDQTLDIFGPNSDNAPDSNGFAHQHSELNPDSIVMFGRVGGTDNYPSAGTGEGDGYSSLNTSFTVAAPVAFTIAATESANPRPSTYWRVSFTKGQQEVFNWQWLGPTDPLTLSAAASGMLDAGTYTLDAYFFDGWVGLSTGTRFTDHTVTLTVPEPATLAPLLLAGAMLRVKKAQRGLRKGLS